MSTMLIKIFTKEMFDKMYVEYDSATGIKRVKDDCPKDEFEKRKKEDEEFFRKEGRHLYANFVE